MRISNNSRYRNCKATFYFRQVENRHHC